MIQVVDFANRDYLGFKLRYIPDRDVFQFFAGSKGSWEGSLREVWQKMHWEFEIDNSEVRLALAEMDKKGHFMAEFGVWGTFICTFKK